MRDLGPALGGVPVPSGTVGAAPPPGGTSVQATVAISAADVERLAGWRPTLRQTAGLGAGRTITLTSARMTIGRASGSDITIPDGSVSRAHAEIRFEDGRWVIEDLRSANGVKLDGNPVQTAPLVPGCTLALGNAQLVFEQPVPDVPPAERLALLGRTDLLANLGEAARGDMAAGLEARFFPGGAVIARAGTALEAMLFVVAGSVRVVEINDEGGERVVERLGPGGCIGDRLLVAGGAHSHTLVADTEVCVLALPKERLQALRRTRPEVNETIVLGTRHKLRTAQSKVPEGVQRRDAIEHLAVPTAVEIVGEDLKIQQARARVEAAARAGAHLLVVGGRGVGKKTFARYYHHTRAGASQPYAEISLAEIEPASVGAAIFGVEADPANPADAGQTGLLETVGEGTLAIIHAELLDVHQQSQLLTYLKRGWYFRQYGRQAVPGTTRLVLVATGSEAEVAARLIPELREALAEHKVVIPPLPQRLKDIPLLANHFLKLGARRSGRKALSLSREAVDRLVSYGWPGNVLELENVMERAAIVASEDTIVAPDLIFVAPPEKEIHKLNLLRNEKLRAFLRKPTLMAALTWVNIAFVALVTLFTLYGATRPLGHPLREATTNPGMLVTWSVWFVFLPLGTVLVGRIWCGMCPIAGIGDLVARLKRFNLPVPKFLKRLDFCGLVIAYIAVDLSESIVEIDDSPLSTGIFLLVVLYLAIAFTVLFERRAFCRHLCPLAGWLGAYSTLAPIEIRGNKKVCQTQCGEHTCYKGTGTVEGCPMFLYPASMATNAECLLCTKCVQACEHKGVQLNLRPPLSELWRNSQPIPALSVFSVMLIGIMGFHQFKGLAWFKPLKASFIASSQVRNPVLMGSFILVCVLGLALAATLSAAASRERVRDNLAAYGIGFVPLAFSGHAAHLLEEFLGDGLYELLAYAKKLWDSVLNGIPMAGREELVAPFVNPAVITFLKFLVVSGGISGSAVALVMIARRGGPRDALARALPHLLLLGVLAVVYYVIFLGTQA
ncbi:MAG TPA: sigma 54-interacting transcriptional regulator [Thermoanaerobaculaceae bacterium]|nr:sigma 54-interacting transcriptional regulator [Thermoanaerobaculaceae bacterium]HRS14804.1 sigma 54-interacting transcriptional regulator [Thermoanaerobaculaceae bacterium]